MQKQRKIAQVGLRVQAYSKIIYRGGAPRLSPAILRGLTEAHTKETKERQDTDMKKYRVTFSGRNKSFYKDVAAKDIRAAMDIGVTYAEECGLRYKGYSNVSVEEVPTGASVIGIEFEYYDSAFKRTFRECMMIRANSERQAHDYYNEHLYGEHFKGQQNIGKVEASGKCTYGRVYETYFAACDGCHIDISKGV